MNRRKVQRYKTISFICIVILICELCYIGYRTLYRSEKSVYFEGVNAIISTDNSYITVGSNNDNDNHYEKAKISYYNLAKEKVFEKLYNIGYNSSFFGVAVDGEDVIAVGSYEKEEKDHNDSVRRALIVKYDSIGNVVFEKDFGLLDNSKFTSVVVDGEYYYVTGQSIYRNTRVGNKDGGAILLKYNKDGELIWYKTYGSSKNSIYNDLVIEGGNIYTVGTDNNYIGVIVKYDLDGNYLTYNDYKTTDSIGFSGIVATNKSIYVSGALRRENDNTDAMIVRYSYDCRYIDQAVYTGEGIERYNKMIVDDQGSIVAIGTQAIAQEDVGITEYNYDGIIAKYDEDLKQIDLVNYGADRDDYFTDIIFDKGEYVVAGYSFYDEGSYMSKFIRYSKALKVLGVQ